VAPGQCRLNFFFNPSGRSVGRGNGGGDERTKKVPHTGSAALHVQVDDIITLSSDVINTVPATARNDITTLRSGEKVQQSGEVRNNQAKLGPFKPRRWRGTPTTVCEMIPRGVQHFVALPRQINNGS
jgi:hypothetical protein